MEKKCREGRKEGEGVGFFRNQKPALGVPTIGILKKSKAGVGSAGLWNLKKKQKLALGVPAIEIFSKAKTAVGNAGH